MNAIEAGNRAIHHDTSLRCNRHPPATNDRRDITSSVPHYMSGEDMGYEPFTEIFLSAESTFG